MIPDEGDVIINGVSVVLHPRGARLSLGVCPQFTAIDSQLTVREHLKVSIFYFLSSSVRFLTRRRYTVD